VCSAFPILRPSHNGRAGQWEYYEATPSHFLRRGRVLTVSAPQDGAQPGLPCSSLMIIVSSLERGASTCTTHFGPAIRWRRRDQTESGRSRCAMSDAALFCLCHGLHPRGRVVPRHCTRTKEYPCSVLYRRYLASLRSDQWLHKAPQPTSFTLESRSLCAPKPNLCHRQARAGHTRETEIHE
jgi:hypothetical protein